jgi:hypothetical protein
MAEFLLDLSRYVIPFLKADKDTFWIFHKQYDDPERGQEELRSHQQRRIDRDIKDSPPQSDTPLRGQRAT